jgi:hypothetical protein
MSLQREGGLRLPTQLHTSGEGMMLFLFFWEPPNCKVSLEQALLSGYTRLALYLDSSCGRWRRSTLWCFAILSEDRRRQRVPVIAVFEAETLRGNPGPGSPPWHALHARRQSDRAETRLAKYMKKKQRVEKYPRTGVSISRGTDSDLRHFLCSFNRKHSVECKHAGEAR